MYFKFLKDKYNTQVSWKTTLLGMEAQLKICQIHMHITRGVENLLHIMEKKTQGYILCNRKQVNYNQIQPRQYTFHSDLANV